MAEQQANTTTDDPGAQPAPHATLDELVAEPERVASAADAAPVRIERPNGAPLVLVSAEEFERLRLLEPKALRAADLTDEEVEYMLAQPIPPDLARFDDEVPEGWFDRRG